MAKYSYMQKCLAKIIVSVMYMYTVYSWHWVMYRCMETWLY